jgi:hypothetical protein
MRNISDEYRQSSNAHLNELSYLTDLLRDLTRDRRHCMNCTVDGWAESTEYREIYKREIPVAYRCDCYKAWKDTAESLLKEMRVDCKRGDEPPELPDWAWDHHKIYPEGPKPSPEQMARARAAIEGVSFEVPVVDAPEPEPATEDNPW